MTKRDMLARQILPHLQSLNPSRGESITENVRKLPHFPLRVNEQLVSTRQKLPMYFLYTRRPHKTRARQSFGVLKVVFLDLRVLLLHN